MKTADQIALYAHLDAEYEATTEGVRKLNPSLDAPPIELDEPHMTGWPLLAVWALLLGVGGLISYAVGTGLYLLAHTR